VRSIEKKGDSKGKILQDKRSQNKHFHTKVFFFQLSNKLKKGEVKWGLAKTPFVGVKKKTGGGVRTSLKKKRETAENNQGNDGEGGAEKRVGVKRKRGNAMRQTTKGKMETIMLWYSL